MKRSLPHLSCACLILLLSACARQDSATVAHQPEPVQEPSTTAQPNLGISVAGPSAPSPESSPPQPPTTAAPSYEVAIATAVSDHERALDECKALAESERKDCVKKSDSVYLEAKTQADKGRAE